MTLLELLIATALVAVAALVVAQSFAAGIRVWSRASQLAGAYSDAIISIETLQQDLRNTVPCRQNAFRGGATWVEIPAIVKGAGPAEQPGLIRYNLDVVGQKLDRESSPCEPGGLGSPHQETVASGVKEVTFIYAEQEGASGGTLSWGRTWEGRTNNPAAVKVIWRGQQGETAFELERTVPIPCR